VQQNPNSSGVKSISQTGKTNAKEENAMDKKKLLWAALAATAGCGAAAGLWWFARNRRRGRR